MNTDQFKNENHSRPQSK